MLKSFTFFCCFMLSLATGFSQKQKGKPKKPLIVFVTGDHEYSGEATLGHPEDFDQEPFQHMVINAIHWAAGKPVTKKWKGPMQINVPYRK